MIVFCIDFETTGLDLERLQPVQLAIMALDTKAEMPKTIRQAKISSWLLNWKTLIFDRDDLPAAVMNMRQFQKMCYQRPLEDWEKMIYMPEDERELFEEVRKYIRSFSPDRSIVVAGKNAATFDVPIFEQLFKETDVRISRRVVDPTAYFTDYDKDLYPPAMDKLVERLGKTGCKVYPDRVHDASYDVYHTALAVWLGANRKGQILAG